MNSLPVEPASVVTPEEEERRIAEYRRLGLQRQAPAQVVYQEPHVACPWPGCGLRIAGIRFNLEKFGDQEAAARWLAAWWKGPGLVGRCPGCGQHVLFEITGKRPVEDPAAFAARLLPDSWHKTAHLVIRG